MSAAASSPRQSPLISVLAIAAIAAMVAAYFMPVWWVSLTAPNYPADAFPDGIKIMFGFTGVTNGCTSAPKTSRHNQETTQEDLGWRSQEGGIEKEPADKKPEAVLDCMHEMNTINHYVGMHPIGVGAPVERLLSKYIIGLFAVALLAFALGSQKARVGVLAVGFAGVSGWMGFDLWGRGVLAEHVKQYMEDAAKYFNDAERIARWGDNLTRAVTIVAVVLVVLMVAITLASAKWPRFQLVLGIVPALLPGFFIGAFAAWLYFFGHNMHPWGAFTVKPFMPTVFGDGKVAQFSTHSYPTAAFALLVAVTVLLAVAVLRRRVEYLEAGK
ncbi:MAG: hypothetical protein ACOZQL_18230 [Myxococcota bacterium]